MHNISALPQIKWDYHSPHLPGGGNDRTGAPADEGINGEKTGWFGHVAQATQFLPPSYDAV